MTQKKKAKMSQFLQKSASAMMAFTLLSTSMPVGFSTEYIAKVSAQTAATNANQEIAGLTFTATPEKYQAFTNTQTGAQPSELSVNLSVTVSESYQDNGVIKLDLPQTPTGANWTEVYGPIFSLSSTQGDVVREFDTTTEAGKLLIKLKSKAEGVTAGVHPIVLKFAFNNQYDKKVPRDTVMYTIQPKAYINGTEAVVAQAKNIVSANALLNTKVTASYQNPVNENYATNQLAFRLYTNFYWTETVQWDRNGTNRVVLQIPAGSTLDRTANFSNYFTFDKKVTVEGVEYDQYIHNITFDANNRVTRQDVNEFQIGRNPTQNYLREDIFITPPAALKQTGATFKIRGGTELTAVNGETISDIQETNYVRVNKDEWNLVYSVNNEMLHSYGGSRRPVARTDNDRVMGGGIGAFGFNYNDRNTMKNVGSGPIKGVKFEYLYDENNKALEDLLPSDSPRVNFASVKLRIGRSDELPAWSQYKYYFEIVDTKKTKSLDDDTTRNSAEEMISTTDAGADVTLNMNLPTLNDGEYINKIVVVPMGTDGQSEGEWPSENALRLEYLVKWVQGKWPDGSVATGKLAEIRMKARFSYLENPNAPAAYPADTSNLQTVSKDSQTVSVFYTNSPHAGLRVRNMQAGASSVPGDVLSYKFIGSNSDWYSNAEWENPRMMIRLPKWATIKGAENGVTLTDVSKRNTNGQTAPVTVTLTGSNNNYNYYTFQVEWYTAPVYGGPEYPIFEIPFEIQVNNGATAGKVAIPYYVSQKDAANFHSAAISSNKLNQSSTETTPDQLRTLFGMGANDNWKYWGDAWNDDAINIGNRTSVAVSTTIKNSATNGQFSPASVVPARSNEDVTIRLTLTNNGSTTLEKLKIYNILPANADALGSSGDIILKNVVSNKPGFTIKTTKTPTADLLKYGEHNTTGAVEPDLQTTTIPGNWVEGIPADTTGLSGLYIDSGRARLAPGEELTVDLIFTIPDGVSQSAFNQFRYSAQQLGNANEKFNLNSVKAGFDTTYVDDRAPVVTLVGKDTISVRQNATFTDPGATWEDNIDGTGRIARGTIVEKNGQPVQNGGTDIDLSEVATYKLAYTYTDVANNAGNTVYRTLRVTDAIAPEIIFKNGVTEENGIYKLNVEMQSNFNPEDYVEISDNIAVTTKGSYLGNTEPKPLPNTFANVDTNTPGQQVISYVATDASGNKTTKKLVITVRDSEPPRITLVGDANMTIPVGATFTDEGANWTDVIDGAGQVQAFDGSVDTATVGTYTLRYKHTDTAGNESQIVTRTVRVVGATKTTLDAAIATATTMTNPTNFPKATGVNGTDTNTAKTALTDALAAATDVKNNPNATQDEVDAATAALTDAINNIAIDTEKPVITFGPTAQTSYVVGTAVDTLAGVTATDKVRPTDNPVDVTPNIVIENENPTFDANAVGTYTLTYSVTDEAGNKTTQTRTITIVEANDDALVRKKKEATDALKNPKVVNDAQKQALVDEVAAAQAIIDNPNSTPDQIAQGVTALQEKIAALNIDTIPPVITPNPNLPDRVKVGESLDVIANLTSIDNFDGDITTGVTYEVKKVTGYETSGAPILGSTIATGTATTPMTNFAKIGDVAIVYTSTDARGNTATTTHVVSVERANADTLRTAIATAESAAQNPNTVANTALTDLTEAIKAATAILNDENSTQEQIDAATEDVKAKTDAISQRNPEKITTLQDIANATTASLTHPDVVNDETKKKLDDILATVPTILADPATTNEQIDAKIAEITETVNQIKTRNPNGFTDLRDAIGKGTEASNDPQTVHNDTKTRLDDEIAKATTLLDNPATTQEQIDETIKAITTLIDELGKRDTSLFDDIDAFAKKAKDESNAPDVINDENKAKLDQAIKDLEDMKNDPRASNEDVKNKKQEILDAIAKLTKRTANVGAGGYVAPTTPANAVGGPIVPDMTPSVSNNSDMVTPVDNVSNYDVSANKEEPANETLSNGGVVNTSAPVANSSNNPTTTAITPVAPRVENGNILTQAITKKADSENIFTVNNPLTGAVCTDIIRANNYENLIAKDNPQSAPFHDDIAALMMFRGAEKSGENIPNYEEYKKSGVVLNAEYFAPNRSVTRAEFVKMLVRSLSCRYEFVGTDTGFSDVEGDKWYAEYIKFAVENKWINGYKDGTFRPNNPITRDEAAKILARAINLNTENASENTVFADVENGSEFIPYIESLRSLGVMKGKNDTTFAPKENISRGETARIIYRTFFGGKL